jgi:hypothetical protein
LLELIIGEIPVFSVLQTMDKTMRITITRSIREKKSMLTIA